MTTTNESAPAGGECKECAKMIYLGIGHTCTKPICYWHAPAIAPGGDAAIGRAFLTVLADPAHQWRNTGAKPFIDMVAERAAALAPAAQQEGAGSGPPPVFYIQADGTHGEYPTPHAAPPAPDQDQRPAARDGCRKEMDAACGHDNALAAAYRAGWISCTRWANRDDLIADTDSPAYMGERDSALKRIAAQEAAK